MILGGGAGGLAAARAGAWAGARVALVSDAPLGGDCTFTGCVPSKTLIAAARHGLDFPAAAKRVRETVEQVAASETSEVLRQRGVDVIEGRAHLAGRHTLAVANLEISARRIILATGSRPNVPPIDGIGAVDYLTNETVFDLESAPESLGIVGGGTIGCELAQAFSLLGVRVTVLEALPRLLTREEPEASEIVLRALIHGGVDVRLNARIERVVGVEAGPTSLQLAGDSELVVDQLLVATGRRPRSNGLSLDEVGVRTDAEGHIVTNDRLATSAPGIYAVGDVTGKLPFTHAADEMGRLAAGNALRKGVRGRFRTHWIPWATFTDPEVARVGTTESDAPPGSRVAYLPMDEMDRALIDGRTDGYVKIIAGPRRVLRHFGGGEVIGATIVAPRAGEMIHELALAMRTKAFTGRLAQTVHAYPTWSYGIQKAAAQFFGDVEGRKAEPVKRIKPVVPVKKE